VKKIFLCAINNLLSGACSEDCKFCSQSSRYRTDIQRYSFKDVDLVLEEAKKAYKNGATGYCLVTSGKELDEKKLDYICNLASKIKKELPSLRIIACNGLASKEALLALKKSGVQSYNHNLETSKDYYKTICSTHSWEDRFVTCEAVKSVGLSLCCGGIFGMGETPKDRDNLIKSILSLKPSSIPINFYIPNQALPIKKRNLDFKDGLNIIQTLKSKVEKNTILMVAGGRESIFGGREKEMFEAGTNAIVIGNYLTTKGFPPDYDRQKILELGYEVAVGCDGTQ